MLHDGWQFMAVTVWFGVRALAFVTAGRSFLVFTVRPSMPSTGLSFDRACPGLCKRQVQVGIRVSTLPDATCRTNLTMSHVR